LNKTLSDVAWSPDSKQIFTASADKTCKLWDAETRKLIKTFKIADNATVDDQQLGCLWQGTEVVSVSLNGNINYWDLNQEKPRRVIHGHNKGIDAIAYDTVNKKIYSTSYDGILLQWDPATSDSVLFKGKGHSNHVNKLVVQGDKLISAARDDSIRVTSINGGDNGSAVVIVTDGEATDVAASKKQPTLFFASTANDILVVKDGKVVNKQAVTYGPTCIALSADETAIAVGGKDNGIHIYSVSGDKLTENGNWTGHRGNPTSLQYSPDGKYLASCDANRDVFVWDVSAKKLVCNEWQFHSARVNSVAWSPDSDHLASGGIDGMVFVFCRSNPKNKIQLKDVHRGGVSALCWIDTNTLLTGGTDSTLKCFDIKF